MRYIIGTSPSSHPAGDVVMPSGDDASLDEEARRLFLRLGLDKTGARTNNARGSCNKLDPIYRHLQTGGTIYVGNAAAAQCEETMTCVAASRSA
jgi:hypothetical protein